jgi:hypothetical protein
MEDLLGVSYSLIWEVGRGGEADLGVEQGEIDRGVKRALRFLTDFMEELGGELQEIDQEEIDSLFDRRKSRVLTYAGGAWAFFNTAKIFGRPADELWVWDGAPIDSASCDTCASEFPKPPRPLSEMRMPGVDTACKTNCRHEVRRATAADIGR